MYNYLEVTTFINTLCWTKHLQLRDLVNHLSFKIRKKIDLFLNRCFPRHWIPLYSMVTFTCIPYHEAVARRQWQDKVGILPNIQIISAFLIDYQPMHPFTIADSNCQSRIVCRHDHLSSTLVKTPLISHLLIKHIITIWIYDITARIVDIDGRRHRLCCGNSRRCQRITINRIVRIDMRFRWSTCT